MKKIYRRVRAWVLSLRHAGWLAFILMGSGVLLSCNSLTYTRPLKADRTQILTAVREVLEGQGYVMARMDEQAGLVETRWKRHHGSDPDGPVRIKVNGKLEEVDGEIKFGFGSEVEIEKQESILRGGEEPIWTSGSRDMEEEERLVMLVHNKLGMMKLRN